MRSLRFCFLTTFYPPYNFGGDGIGVQRLARALVRRGHHVTVVHDVDAYNLLHEGPEPVTTEESEEGLDVVPLRSGLGALSCLLTHQTGHPVVNGRRIRDVLDRGFDVLQFHNVSLLGGPGLLSYGGDALRLYMAHEHWLVCPTHVLWRHGRELCTGRECIRCALHHRRPPQLFRYTGAMERHLEQVDTYIALSEFSREKHHEFGFPHPMEVLPPFLAHAKGGSVPEPGPSPHHRPYFLFVGRLERIKGLDTVIPLLRRYGEADLLVVGEGAHGPELRRLAEGAEGIRFVGRVPREELAGYYANALALLVPSVCFETFGIILIEAFSHGTPVIARRLGPFPEIVRHSGGGELFETDEELLDALRRIQTDPAHREALGRRGHDAFLSTWTESAVIPRYLKIVRDTAEATGRSDIVQALAGAGAA